MRSIIFVSIALLTFHSASGFASLQQHCSKSLIDSSTSSARIISVEWIASGSPRQQQSIPAHCRPVGSINERRSPVDGQDHAIGFELRLPKNWNRRFLVQANGGNDGSLVPA